METFTHALIGIAGGLVLSAAVTMLMHRLLWRKPSRSELVKLALASLNEPDPTHSTAERVGI